MTFFARHLRDKEGGVVVVVTVDNKEEAQQAMNIFDEAEAVLPSST